jgi:hypothetical protein
VLPALETASRIVNNLTGRPIEMAGSSGGWQISGNSFDANTNNGPAPLSVDTTVIDNAGYNPVGAITNPWQSGGDLTNDGGGDPNPTSGVLYTVRQSAKTVVVTAGAVTGIAINGTSTSLSEGVFKLGIGETIAVTYSVTPTSTVWAD